MRRTGRLAPKSPQFPARAKRVLHIFCTGAVSHLDTWDYKPELIKRHGQPMPGVGKPHHLPGRERSAEPEPLDLQARGGSRGKYVSDLLPHLAARVDDLCFIHSLTSKTNTHGPGEMFMSTGFTLEGFPSIGAWVSYALGTENQDLPAYVAIPDPRGDPQQGPANWMSGFLPAVYQGTSLSADKPIRHLARPREIAPGDDQAALDFLRLLNDEHLQRHPGDTDLAARIASYELAARMQLERSGSRRPVAREPGDPRDIWCRRSQPDPRRLRPQLPAGCRLLERGVRFVTLFNGAFAMGEGALNWDGHKRIKSDYDRHGPILDRPAAGLLIDLKARGLLDDTLVVWTTEFGRMPTFQKGAQGRDHNPKGFTAWFAGAGVKRGFSFGATDSIGYQAVENVVDVHDFHATILHLLGLNHETLTYYHNGTRRRLTDVHGHVIRDVLT